MAGLAEVAIDVLEPYVGRMVAGTCIGATAISVGKTRDKLSADDMPELTRNIRKLLATVAPLATIEAIIADFESRIA